MLWGGDKNEYGKKTQQIKTKSTNKNTQKKMGGAEFIDADHKWRK